MNDLNLIKAERTLQKQAHRKKLKEMKEKWNRINEKLSNELEQIQNEYDKEKQQWTEKLVALNDSLRSLEDRSREEEKQDRNFILKIDSLLAFASQSIKNDEIQARNIEKARKKLKSLIEKNYKTSRLPPLSNWKIPNEKVGSEKKGCLNAFDLNSLSLSSREGVAYSIINSGFFGDDVSMKDLENIPSGRVVLSTGRIEEVDGEEDSKSESLEVPELDGKIVKNAPPLSSLESSNSQAFNSRSIDSSYRLRSLNQSEEPIHESEESLELREDCKGFLEKFKFHNSDSSFN